MDKQQLKELAATLAAIADGAEWEFNSKEYSLWAKPSAFHCPVDLVGKGYEIRLTQEAAALHGKALASFTERKEKA